MLTRQLQTGTIAVTEHEGVTRARGVPYGKAKRFEVARPVEPFVGVFDARNPGPACPQLRSRLEWITGPILYDSPTNEDCLVVSITAPVRANGLAVMVWFHGGAYVSGSGESPKYDGGLLAREGDVVVVNVSYRLGIFGYVSPGVSDDDGNLGLRDQLLALRWIRDNIAAFGGDPGNVTVFGQSAGADSIVAMMCCEDAVGLFHRAIVQSAPLGLGEGRGTLEAAMKAAMIGVLGDTPPVEAPIALLLKAQSAATLVAQQFGLLGGLPFAPRPGTPPLPPPATSALRIAAAARHFELLIGYTRNDAAAFVAMSTRVGRFARWPRIRGLIVRAGDATMTNRIFADPAHGLVDQWRHHGGRAGLYRFDWRPASAPLGACHCIELPFLFGTPEIWSDAPMLGPRRWIDPQLATDMRRRWSDFAKNGLADMPAVLQTIS